MRWLSVALSVLALGTTACVPEPKTPQTSSSGLVNAADQTIVAPDKIGSLLLDKDEINIRRPGQEHPLVQQNSPNSKPMANEYVSVDPQSCFDIAQRFHSGIFGDSYSAYINRQLEGQQGPRHHGYPFNVVTETIALYPDIATASAALERLQKNLRSCGNSTGIAHWENDISPMVKFQITAGNRTDASASWQFGWALDGKATTFDSEEHQARLAKNALIEVVVIHSNDAAEAASSIADALASRVEKAAK